MFSRDDAAVVYTFCILSLFLTGQRINWRMQDVRIDNKKRENV